MAINLNVMIDLETLGTSQDSVFFSCGACFFNIETGEIGQEFYWKISIQDQLNNGRKVSAYTLCFWMKQDDAARKEITEEGDNLKDFLSTFSSYLNHKDGEPIVWGNGATFDISILENAYDGSPPWRFWNVRDVRTIRDLAYPNVDIKNIQFEGIKHNALADAIHQAKYVSAMYRILKRI